MNPFIKDRTVWVDGVEMRVVRQLANQDVQLEKTTSGELVSHEIQELLQKYANGHLLTAPMRCSCWRRIRAMSTRPFRK